MNEEDAISTQPIARWWRLRVCATIAFAIWLIILAVAPARSQGASATVPAAPEPFAVAVNTKTNKIYVLHEDTSTVSVIDGPTNTATTITGPGGIPRAVAAEPASNKIYVVNLGTWNYTVIDGATNATATVQKVYDNLDYVRGVDAFMSSFSGASAYAIRQASIALEPRTTHC